MSGIYISGLDIPAQGSVTLHLCASGAVETSSGKLQAVPVPDHGRLGDLDALAKALIDEAVQHTIIGDLNRMTFGVGDALCWIGRAPTVIPADQEAPT